MQYRWYRPLPQTMPTTPVAMSANPTLFCGVNASFKIAAASTATISGITPGKSAPACDAGANSKPAVRQQDCGRATEHERGQSNPTKAVQSKIRVAADRATEPTRPRRSESQKYPKA